MKEKEQERVITSLQAERELHELISKQDVWTICRSLPDLFTGFDVEAMVLFGSRARGDHQIDSDVDIAVILRGCVPWPGSIKFIKEFGHITYPIELNTGLLISAIAIPIEYMREPSLAPNPALYENIRREGLVFWELGEAIDPPLKWHVQG